MEKNNRIFILIFLGMLTAFGPFVTGSVGLAAVSVLLCAAMCLGCSFWLYEILLLFLLAMLGLTFTSSNTLAMDAGREHAGAGSVLSSVFAIAAVRMHTTAGDSLSRVKN